MNLEREIRILQRLTNPIGAIHLVDSFRDDGFDVEHESTLVTIYPNNIRSIENLITGTIIVERKVERNEERSSHRTHKFVTSNEYPLESKDIETLEPTNKVYRIRHLIRNIASKVLDSTGYRRHQQLPILDLHVTTRTIIGQKISQSVSVEIESNVTLTSTYQDTIVQNILQRHNGWRVPNIHSMVTNAYNDIVEVGLIHPGILQKPYDIGWQDITYKNLIERRHAITFKADGIRTLLALTSQGTFLVTSNLDLMPLNDIPWSMGTTILDGEFVGPSTLWLFDALVINGENIMAQGLESRRDQMELILSEIENIRVKGSSLGIVGNLQVKVKPQTIPTDPSTFFQAVENMITMPLMPTDGIILTGIDQAYSQSVYKWKPSTLMSVDFFILPGPVLATMTPDGLLSHPELKPTIPEGVIGTVGEFKWDGNNLWSYVRPRFDKATPNAERVYQAIEHLHKDPITKEAITGKSLRLMRKYHNRVKRQIYAYMASKGVGTLIDIGSGKGGDLPSWKEHSLDVVAIEPNETNVQDLISRARSMGAVIEGVDPYYILGEDWSTRLYHESVERWLSHRSSSELPSHALTLFNVATFLGPETLSILSQDVVRDDGIIVIMVMDGKILEEMFLGPDAKISDPNLVDIRRIQCTSASRFGDLGCISIRLIDSATVTTAQIEGLVDVEAMIKVLRDSGWVPDLDIFLDRELLLGPEEAAYSRAQRLLVLKPLVHPTTIVRSTITPLARGQNEGLDTPWGQVVRIGVPGPGIHLGLPYQFISFIHSLLQATDGHYQRLDPVSKAMYALPFITQRRIPLTTRPIYLIPYSSWDMVTSDREGQIIVYPALSPQIVRSSGIVLLQLDPTTWEPLAKRTPEGSLTYIW